MYCGHVDKLQVFNENDEMDKIMLWDLEINIGEFDKVDRKMIELENTLTKRLNIIRNWE